MIKDFRLNVLTVLGLDFDKLNEEDFKQKQPEDITRELFKVVNANYNNKNKSISEAAYPILKKIKKETFFFDLFILINKFNVLIANS